MIAREAFAPRNYAALWKMRQRYPDFTESLDRYFLGRGDYPYACRVRTPCGVVAPTLYSHHDMFTVNEVFCREDYAVGPDLRVAVDVGSNIGISALYFLTRNEFSRCWLFEPDPRNLERLHRNLAGFAARFVLHEAAVADRAGTVAFGIEHSGRYGGIGLERPETIRVRCLDVNNVLEDVLAAEGRIDVLKIDTEGAELATVRAIRPELLAEIGVIYFEAETRPALDLPQFDGAFANKTCRLLNRSRRAAAQRLA